MRYSPGSLTTDPSARRAAQDFANLVGAIVNATVSAAPISFLEVEGPEFEGFVAHRNGRVPVAMPIGNGRHLFIYHRLGLRREERFLTTLEYKYQYQETADDDSWIFRYEYQREPPDGYPYPLAHVHVNAVPESYSTSKAFPRLHLPTGTRVRIEDVVRHLLDEHEVPAISPNWQTVLAGAEADFAEIQKRRIVG